MNERHPIRVWTGQFNIIDGDVREEGANVATFEGRPSNGEIPALYIVAEPAAPESEGMVGQMVQAIGQLFARQEVSLTGNLLRALRGAHESLFRWNLQQGGSVARSSAGCSAAVVLGSDVYLAQCGPAVAYYLGAGGFERISPGPAAQHPDRCRGSAAPITDALHAGAGRRAAARALDARQPRPRRPDRDADGAVAGGRAARALPDSQGAGELLGAAAGGCPGDGGCRTRTLRRTLVGATPSQRNPFGR